MNKFTILTLGTVIMGAGLAGEARAQKAEVLPIVRLKNEDPRLTAHIIARYQIVAEPPLIGMSAPLLITQKLKPEKDLDLATAIGNLPLQNIMVTFPDKKEALEVDEPQEEQEKALEIDKPQAGREYLIHYKHITEKKLKL
jgi:hypothetical protein